MRFRVLRKEKEEQKRNSEGQRRWIVAMDQLQMETNDLMFVRKKGSKFKTNQMLICPWFPIVC